MLRCRPADERLARFSLVATAAGGITAILVALGRLPWRIGHGERGTDFATVSFPAGAGYLVALGRRRRRSAHA